MPYVFSAALSCGTLALATFQACASLPPEPRVLARAAGAVVAMAVAVAWLLSRMAVDSMGVRSGVLLAGLMMLAFPMFTRWFAPGAGACTAYLAAAALLAVGASRSPESSRREIAGLAAPVAVAVAAVSVLMVAAGYAWRGPSMVDEARYRAVVDQPVVLRPGAALPDIYHVILDGLGSPMTLTTSFAIASKEVDALGDHGFVVSESTISNYTQTYLSLASILNMAYLDPIAEAMVGQQARAPLIELIQRSNVIKSLKDTGYSFHFIGSGQPATARHRLADRCDCSIPTIAEFESHLLRLTPAGYLPWHALQHEPHRAWVREQLSLLQSLPDGGSRRPRLVVGHIMSPHPPFIMNADGAAVVPDRPYAVADGNAFSGTPAEYRAGYAAQARFVLRTLPLLADAFVRQSRQRGREAIVIFHGDHGPRSRFDAGDAARTDASEVFPVFFAIRWPTELSATAPAISSLVNMYRVVLSHGLGATLPALPDRALVSSFVRPYDLIEVSLPTAVRARGTP